MKGVGRLIKNELVKIFGQLSWKIITVIILVLALLMPLANTMLNSFAYSYDNYYQEMYEEAPEGSIQKEYYGVLSDAEDFFIENEITYDDWRYEEYYIDYQDLASTVKAFELIKNGKTPEEVFDWFYALCINYTYDEDDNLIIEYYDDETGESGPVTTEIAEREYAKNKAAFDEMTDEILNGSIRTYASNMIEMLKLQITLEEEEFAASEAAYESDPEKLYDYQEDYFNLYASRASLAVWEVLANASEEDEEWLFNTARQTLFYTDKGSQLATMNRESFEAEPYIVEMYGSYEKYCEVMEKSYYDNIAAVDILRYSAENGKPLPDMLSESTRNIMVNAIAGNASTILLFCVILGATIVASEHMTGTIRLLVIRPRARWKILLSKLLAIVIYGLSMFVASSVLSAVMTLIVAGTGDLSVPMLIYRHGDVKEVSLVIHTIARLAVSALPNLFILSMAFFLSVAAKKVVFAVAIPMFITTFGSAVASMVMLFFAKLPFLKWTLLPYFIIDGYTTDVVMRTSGDFFGTDFVSMGFELEIGVVLFLVHIAIFTALSFIVFRRQQIKN